MRWTPGGRSSDLEDRRGSSGGGFGGGGMRIGLGGAAVLLVLSLVFKQNFFALLGGGGGRRRAGGRRTGREHSGGGKEGRVRVLRPRRRAGDLGAPLPGPRPDLRARQAGALPRRDPDRPAASPRRRPVRSIARATRRSTSTSGFYDELQQRFGAPGDFAQAYVLAHELGHHVQRLLGTEAQVREAQQQPARPRQRALGAAGAAGGLLRRRLGPRDRRSGDILEPGDVDEGLGAAAAVGDDRIQRMQGQGVHPEGFTHGSSEQRASWFRRGFESGRPEDCDTFKS